VQVYTIWQEIFHSKYGLHLADTLAIHKLYVHIVQFNRIFVEFVKEIQMFPWKIMKATSALPRSTNVSNAQNLCGLIKKGKYFIHNKQQHTYVG